MKQSKLFSTILTVVFSVLLLTPSANAGLINSNLGNTAHGASALDGTVYTLAEIQAIQAGQSAPFDLAIGSDVFSELQHALWSHSYGVITDSIVSATFTFGIIDHDSAGIGSQLSHFVLGNVDTTTTLDNLFEAVGNQSTDHQYKQYMITLDSSYHAALASGLFNVDLMLGGSGLQTRAVFLGGGEVDSPFNGFFLTHSSLSITTEDSSGQNPQPVPEPSTLLLFALSIIGLNSRFKRSNK